MANHINNTDDGAVDDSWLLVVTGGAEGGAEGDAEGKEPVYASADTVD